MTRKAMFLFCLILFAGVLLLPNAPGQVAFSSHQVVDIDSTGWSGTYSWNFAANTGSWTGDKEGDYSTSFIINHGDWFALFLYDIDSSGWKEGMYFLNMAWETSIDMVAVPAGTFVMGNSGWGDDAAYGQDDEIPTHTVTLSAFEIGKYEITNAQYVEALNWALGEDFLEDANGNAYTSGSVYLHTDLLLEIEDQHCQISFIEGAFVPEIREGLPMAIHPVVEVSWCGAVAFCNWRSLLDGFTPAYDLATWELVDADLGKEGLQYASGYRLPTEAEWEFAAGWNGSERWIYGYASDTPSTASMNYGLINPLDFSFYPLTTPVGFYNGTGATLNSQSPLGCYDMSGNVWEWCHDRYDSGYYGVSDSVNPTGPTEGTDRVLRGGSWWGHELDARIADRTWRDRHRTNSPLGFRPVRTR